MAVLQKPNLKSQKTVLSQRIQNSYQEETHHATGKQKSSSMNQGKKLMKRRNILSQRLKETLKKEPNRSYEAEELNK